jgi:hypothetical protein
MRKCALDLAPEAPWNCPADCSGYQRRLADVNWRHGSLITPATPEPPPSVGEDPSVAALLDSAEDIINSVGPSVREQIEAEIAEANKPRWKKLWPFNRS